MNKEFKAGIDYTCLFSKDSLEGGEWFSGGGLVTDIEEELDLILGEDGLRSALKYALKQPPCCIMLHIQTREVEDCIKE